MSTVYWGSNVVPKLARAILYTFVWMAFCFCMHQYGGRRRWELVWFLNFSIGCACERSFSIQTPKLEVVTHADALIQGHSTGLGWQRMAAAMLGGIFWSVGNSFPYAESNKCLQSLFWWPFWPRIRIYSRSASEESCSTVALEKFRGQCQDAPNDDKWKQWPAARNKNFSRCACIGTCNTRLRTYIHVCWDHAGYSLYCLFHCKMGSPCLCKIAVPAHIL